MDKRLAPYLKLGLAFLLVGISISCVVLYISSLEERYDLSTEVGKLKLQVESLGIEKEALSQELEAKKQLEQSLVKKNKELQDVIEPIQEQMAKLNAAFTAAQDKIENLNTQVQDLQKQNTALSTEKTTRDAKLLQVTQEKEVLESRFNSLSELKKAIRELKQKIRLARVSVRKHTRPERTIEGNQGFLIRDGKPTYPTHKVKIEVRPNFHNLNPHTSP